MGRDDKLAELFRQLPQMQRSCVILHHRGYSASQIVETLQIPRAAVFPQVVDAHIRLQALLRSDRRFRSLVDEED
jgi:hypothetical protein